MGSADREEEIVGLFSLMWRTLRWCGVGAMGAVAGLAWPDLAVPEDGGRG
jgi:hypothetical protein